MASDPGGNVKSAIRTLELLELMVSQARPMQASEIAAALAIPVSSLSYLLSTLTDRGYLLREGRQYRTGNSMERLRRRDVAPTLTERVQPLLRMIRHELGETATFFVRQGDEIEAIATDVSQQPLQYRVNIGQRAPLYCFSGGKALLAALDPAELDAYLSATERIAFTPRTLIDEADLRADLDEVRRTGIARTPEEHTPGIVGIGRAAIVDGEVAGAFSIAIPLARYDAAIDARTVRLLISATDRLA